MTWRLAGLLIERLPPESATKTAIRDSLTPEQLAAHRGDDGDTERRFGPYSNLDMHMAVLIDEIRWLRYAVYASVGADPEEPKPYPRPGLTAAKKVSPEALDYLARLKAERATAAVNVPIPEHIRTAAAKQLGPAEQQWLQTSINPTT